MKKSIKSTIAIFLSIMIFVLSPLSVLAELEEKTDEKVSGIEDEISLSLKDGEFTFKKSELDIKTQRDKILAKIKDGLEDSNYAFPLELAVQPETPEQRLAWNSSGFNWVVVIDAWIKYIPDSDSMKPAIEYIKQKLEFLSNARLAIDLSNMVTGEYVGNIYLNKEWKFSSSVPQLQMMKFDDRCILDVNKETGESFLKIFLVQNQKDSIKNNIYLQRGLDDVELTLTEQQIILDESLDSTEGPKENPYGYVTIPIPKKGENLKIYSGSKSLEKLKDSDWYDLSFGEEWKLKDDSILKKPELLYINKRVFNFYDKVDNKQSEWDKEINGEWYSPFNNGQTAFIQTDGGEQVIDIYANNSLGADDMESLRFTIDGTEPTKDSREIYHGEYRLYPIDNKTENKTENIDQYQARNYMYMSNPNIYRLIIAGKITYENRIRNKKGTLNYIKHPENIKDGGNIVLKVKAFGKNGKESETLTIEIPQYMKEISFNDKISYKKKIFGKEREVEIVGNQYPMQNHPYRGMDINFTDITSGTEFNNIKNIMKYKNIDKFYVTKPSVSYDADLDKNFWEKSKLIYRVKGLNDLRISGKFASTYEILPNGVINTMDFYYENISNEVAIRFNPTFRNTTSIFAKEDRTKRHSAIKKESQNVLDWLNDLKAKETEGTEKYNEISKNINLLQHKITVVKENNFRDYIELNSLKNIILKSLEEDLDSYKPEEYIEIPNEDNPDEEKPDEPEYNNGMKMQPKDLKAGVYNLPINLLQFDDESLQSMGAQAIKGIAKLYVKEDGKQDLEFEVKQLPVSGIVGNILGFWYYNQPEKNPISGGAESNLLGEPSPFEIIKSEVIYNPHINEDLEVPRLVRKPIIDREPRQYVRVSVDAMDGDGSYDGPTKNAILALDYENLEYIGDIPTDPDKPVNPDKPVDPDKPVNPDKPSDNDDILTNKVALDLAIRLADDIRLSDQYEYITGYPKKLFDKKLGNAKRVYNDSNATNYEILLAASELNSAISQLLLSPSIPVTPEKPSEPEKPILPDVKPEDRIYSVPVKMLMATNDNESMANKVIDKKAFIVEKSNGKSEVYLDFKTLYMENIDLYGNLLKLWHYPGKPEDSSGNIPEAIVVKNRIGKASVEVSKGKFEVKDTELPGRFKLIRDKKREETIYVKVEVDAMEEIAKNSGQENGHQNARVILDWSKAEDITDTNSNLPTEPVNPDNDKKPDSNNTKPDQPSKEKYKAYTVPVKLMKAYENTASMGNGAVIPKAKIVEKDGKSHIYIDMKGLEFMNMKGHLLRLWSYPNGVTEDKSGLVEAKIVERKEDTGLGGKVDKYPSKFEIIRDKSKEEEIGVRVKVDAMAEIDGSGEQDARLVFDWSKAEEIEGGIELPDNNNNDKPSNKYDSEVIYIDGYKDGTFKPDNAISRAEATKILAYALTKEYSKEKNYGNSFNDIKSDAWYAKVVGYMQEIKAINGYEDGSFRADNPITRGEFAKIVALIDGHKANNANKFTDVPKEHWAKPYIEDIGAKGYIKGYPNGDFGADNNITRAEVVAIVNRMIGKDIESFKGKDNLNKFSDMNNNHWAYLDVIAATNK